MLTEAHTAITINLNKETPGKKIARRPLLQDDSSDFEEDNKCIVDAYREEFIAAYDFEDDNMNESSSDHDDADAHYAKVKNTLKPCDKYAESFYDFNHDEYTNGAEDGKCPFFAKRSEYDDNAGESTTDSESGESGYNNNTSLDDSLHDRCVAPYDLFANDDNQNDGNHSDTENLYSYYGDDQCDQNYNSEYGIDDNEVNYIDY